MDKKVIVKAVLWVFSVNMAVVVFRFMTTVALTHFMLPNEMGVAITALAAIGLIEQTVGFCFSQPLIQLDEVSNKTVTTTLFAFTALTMGLHYLATVANLGAFFTAIPEMVDVLPWATAIMPLYALNSIGSAMLSRQLKFKELSLVQGGVFLVTYMPLVILLAALGFSYWAIVIAYFVQVFALATANLYLAREHLNWGWDWSGLSTVVRRGLGFSAFKIAGVCNSFVDQLVLAKWLSAADVGLYSLSNRFIKMPVTIVGQAANKVCFPVFARLQHDEKRSRDLFVYPTVALLLFALPATAFLTSSAEVLFPMFLNDEWQATIPVFQLLAWVMLPRLGVKMAESQLRGGGLVYWRAAIEWAVLGMLLMGIWLVLPMGLIAIVGVIVLLGVLRFMLLVGASIYDLKLSLARAVQLFLLVAVCSLLLYGAFLMLRDVLSVTAPWVTLLALGALTALLYAVIYFKKLHLRIARWWLGPPLEADASGSKT